MKFEAVPDYDQLLLLCSDGNRGLRYLERLIAALDRERVSIVHDSQHGSAAGSMVERKEKYVMLTMLIQKRLSKKQKLVLQKKMKAHQWIIGSTRTRTGPSSKSQLYFTYMI